MKLEDINLDLVHEDVLIEGRIPTFRDHYKDMCGPIKNIRVRKPKTGHERWEADIACLKKYYDMAWATLETELGKNVGK